MAGIGFSANANEVSDSVSFIWSIAEILLPFPRIGCAPSRQ
jgi:hypothetical protein